MIALVRGDLDEADRRAGVVISARRPFAFQAGHDVNRGGAYGIRGWVRAAKGDMEGAMNDARATREYPAPASDALAHASLAEAMVLERRGDRRGLAALLRRDRRLLVSGLSIRERAVVRAMQRLLKASPTSVYRAPASPRGLLTEEEPTLAAWLD